ncbi:hypothetical protein [Thermoactinomyces sp. DSM 45892]|uniref:hypothetical protein n=1 Tax=Thermoactinomyces sp. DSM 45892 TaxID=1882753 RepID=UPI0008955A56|nr:hypothetical protein [Thermoactinomyces sp. DSM 45892]SDY86344.1 hypothetical protein SAMN05444416_109106 [Thermoactinomyces sp. DSM 45892]
MELTKNIKHDINEKEIIQWVADNVDEGWFDRQYNHSNFGCKCGRGEMNSGTHPLVAWWTEDNIFTDNNDEEIEKDHWLYNLCELLKKHNLHRDGGLNVYHCATCGEWAVCAHDA